MNVIKQKGFDLNKFFAKNQKIINKYLDNYLKIKFPNTIWEAMRYSVLAGGKRLRPILTIESAKACGGNIDDVLPTACAIELLHTYTLIHDDLPSMDNDDLRRGKPTCHKMFGEGIAILAGDALFSLANQLIIQNTPKTVPQSKLLQVLEEFAIAGGPQGVVGGQVADIEAEGKEIDLSTFLYIHTHKTGELFKFSLRSGAILGGASETQLNALTEYGKMIGYAFQIADDVLDIISTKEEMGKTTGKDQQQKKNSHPQYYSLEHSIEEVQRLCANAQKVLQDNDIISKELIGIAGSIALKVRK